MDQVPSPKKFDELNEEKVKEVALKRPLEPLPTDEASGEPKKLRIKKKKVAMLMSYCGQGYLGMQINHGFKTIEEDLFQAFIKAGIMNEESYKFPQTIQFQRAARTDKGVSATRQIVSLKMGGGDEETVKKICAHLPDCIRVFSIKKVTAGFNSKWACDSRSYAYILPTFAFASVNQTTNTSYRISSEVLTEVNSLLAIYKGTRNYHNFTSRRTPQDPSCKRFIMEFQTGKPFIIKDMEFVKITVKGQSFMLHQIRKMVGLTIAIMRGFATVETLESAFKMERVDIPIAPSLNLLLEQPHYDTYNQRYAASHEPLIWDAVESDIENFSSKHILPTLYDGEVEGQSMMKWLATLPLHTYTIRDDGPPRSSTRSEFGRAAVAVEIDSIASSAAAPEGPTEKED